MANIDTSAWKEFALEELFTSVNGDTDIQKKHINGKGEYVITSGLQNNGIAGKSDVKARVLPAKTITVDMFGNVFYREHEYKMVTHARVFSIIPKTKFENDNIGLFFASCLSSLYKLFSYDNMCSWEKIKSNKILLPVKEVDEIDYKYMEERVQELEEERVQELDKYLKSVELYNYELTDNDKDILRQRHMEGKVKLSSIFKVSSSKRKFNAIDIKLGSGYRYVARTSLNNGIKGLLDEDVEYLNSENTFSFGQDTATIFYQDKPYFTGDKIKVLSPIDFTLDMEIAMYFKTVLDKYFSTFKWGSSSFNEDVINNAILVLPVKEEKEKYTINDIDFDYMRKYIKVIEKLTIAKIDMNNELVINKTKEIINN